MEPPLACGLVARIKSREATIVVVRLGYFDLLPGIGLHAKGFGLAQNGGAEPAPCVARALTG